MSATTGNDTLTGTAGNDVIDLLAGNDSYLGLDGNDSIFGNDGNDTIYGGNGNDSIAGDNGDDRIYGEAGSDTIDAGAGTLDRILYNQTGGEAITATITSSGGNTGINAATVSTATQGTDRIQGFEALIGSINGDLITVTTAATQNVNLFLFGAAGNDTIIDNYRQNGVFADYNTTFASLTSGVSVDLASGIATDGLGGTDSLVGITAVNGTSFADTMLGSASNDRFRGWQGNDLMDGRGGTGDLVDYAANAGSQAVSVNLAIGRANDGLGGTDTLVSIEQARGGAGNDVLVGDGNNNTFRGNGGSDTINGAGGTADAADYAFAGAAVSVNLATGHAQDGQGGVDSLTGIEYVYGSAYDDTLIGGSGNDSLRGNAGTDSLVGGNGNDTLDAGSGLDATLFGGAGNDLYMLNGEAFVFDTGGSDTVSFLGGGVETISASANDLDDSPGIEAIDLAGTGKLLGLTAAAVIRFSDTDVLRVYGSGNDSLVFEDAGWVRTGKSGGFDTLANAAGNATVITTERLASEDISSVVTGGDGNDTIGTGLGNDTIDGGDGNDLIGAYAGNDFIDGGSGDDSIDAGNGDDTVLRSHGNDLIQGGNGNDNLSGAGRSRLFGGDGNDILKIELVEAGTLMGDGGDDTLIGTPISLIPMGGAFSMAGGEGNDSVTLGTSYISAQVTGGNGDDVLSVGAGVETVDGGAGNDTIIAHNNTFVIFSDGADSYMGGNGIDLLSYEGLTNATQGVTVNLAASVTSGSLGNDRLSGIENVLTGAGNDSVLGDGLANVLSGGNGNDTLAGGAGNDTLSGGNGRDWASYASATGAVTVDLGAGSSSGADGNDSLTGIENILGSNFADSLQGVNGMDQYLDGGAGNDTLVGGMGGNHSLYGGNDADSLQGGNGYSQGLYGEAGNDTLVAGGGVSQRLFGGNDADSLQGGNGYLQGLDGGRGNDTLVAGGGNYQALLGGSDAGADSLRGGNGDYQELYGDAGNDTLVAGGGYDQYLNGGADADSLLGGNGAFQRLYGEAGNDTLIAANGSGQLLDGGNDSDTLLGGNGADTLDGGLGNDSMSGGAGNDVFIVDSAGDRVSDSAGTDTILLRTGSISLAGILVENVTGDISGQTFSITGNSIANVLTGGALADTINASTGNDTIFGGAGNDSLTGGAGNDLIDGGVGLDWANYAELTATSDAVTVNLATGRAVGAAGADTLAGIENVLTGAGNDSLLGDSLGNMLSAGSGNDTLSGGAGDDLIDGGAGLDWANYAELTATSDAVTVSLVSGRAVGAAGADTLAGFENILTGAGNDSLLGDSLGNMLSAGSGNDTLDGGVGNDTLDGGVGNDTMSGGAGNDFFVVDSAGDRVSDSAGTDTILLRTGSISLAGILVENVTGDISGQTFSITGNSAANVLTGGALADTVNGSTGNDTIFGGGGNDSLTGGAGNDLIDGGVGLDWANYAELTATSQAVTVNLVTGRAVGAAGADTLAAIENILTGAGNDSLLGDSLGNMLSAASGNDTLDGGAGNDTLNGGAGSDSMLGGAGNDVFIVDSAGDRVSDSAGTDTILMRTGSISLAGILVENVTGDIAGLAFSITGNNLANVLTGGALADTINGSTGNDTIFGGAGSDSLVGGTGLDQFVFNTALGSSNVDTILGYSVADDTILLDNAVFTAFTSEGALSAGAFATGPSATEADDRIIFNGSTGALLYDADGVGAGAAIQFATLSGLTGTLNAAEFIII